MRENEDWWGAGQWLLLGWLQTTTMKCVFCSDLIWFIFKAWSKKLECFHEKVIINIWRDRCSGLHEKCFPWTNAWYRPVGDAVWARLLPPLGGVSPLEEAQSWDRLWGSEASTHLPFASYVWLKTCSLSFWLWLTAILPSPPPPFRNLPMEHKPK